MVAWDEEHEVRVYRFREISEASYEAVKAIDVLPITADQASERADRMSLLVRDALATSVERTLYVLSSDLSTTITAAKTVDFAEWMSIMKLEHD